jgi:succinate dehydrogenase / fumarate reductase cytochrome b subunit
MTERPLSPHITVWKWGPAMAVSILHRITGDGLALVGLGMLLWWLATLAAGAKAYDAFLELATTPVGYAVMVALSWAFFNHLVSGVRHLVLDIGAGYELDTNKGWSVASLLLPILLTAAFWAAIVLR